MCGVVLQARDSDIFGLGFLPAGLSLRSLPVIVQTPVRFGRFARNPLDELLVVLVRCLHSIGYRKHVFLACRYCEAIEARVKV